MRNNEIIYSVQSMNELGKSAKQRLIPPLNINMKVKLF